MSNSANYDHVASWDGTSPFGNITTVGSNGGPSYYGTYDQSGNVWEWNSLDGVTFGISAGKRGGGWGNDAFGTSAASRSVDQASLGDVTIGLRIASSTNPLSLNNFVTVGDPGNANDIVQPGAPRGWGGVSYIYQINKYNVTNCEYLEFLNAVAKTDTYELYHVGMSVVRCGIYRTGTSGNYIYTLNTNYANKPIVWISWFDSARYCNWLHNGKPTGSQDASTTEDGAYTLNGLNSGNFIGKNSSANYWIPTEDEWHKAAYYKGGSTNAGYWLYATQSDTQPTKVTASSTGDGLIGGSPARVTDYVCSPSSPTSTPGA